MPKVSLKDIHALILELLKTEAGRGAKIEAEIKIEDITDVTPSFENGSISVKVEGVGKAYFLKIKITEETIKRLRHLGFDFGDN